MTKAYKCCVCKKTGGWNFSFFHHFTPKMKERYQCINCRFDRNLKAIAIIREQHKAFKKQMKFLDSLTKIK